MTEFYKGGVRAVINAANNPSQKSESVRNLTILSSGINLEVVTLTELTTFLKEYQKQINKISGLIAAGKKIPNVEITRLDTLAVKIEELTEKLKNSPQFR